MLPGELVKLAEDPVDRFTELDSTVVDIGGGSHQTAGGQVESRDLERCDGE